MTRTTPSRKGYKFDDADFAALRRLLADVPVAHVAFIADGQPFVLPVAAAAGDDCVLLHGSTGSRWLGLIADGIAVSVAITAVDGLVVARSAFESSMHYRSAVLFGTCQRLDGDPKLMALDTLTDALIPGRVAEVRRPTAKELAATLVLCLDIEEWSLKSSDGWPDDPAEDVETDTWAGVLPSRTYYTGARPAPDLRTGSAVPPSVRRLLGR
jgi:hypothetical protein